MNGEARPASQPGHPSSKHQRLRTPFLKNRQRSGLSVMQRRGMVLAREALTQETQCPFEIRVLDLSFHLLGQSRNLSEPHLPHLYKGSKCSSFQGENEITKAKRGPAASLRVSGPSLLLGLSQVCLGSVCAPFFVSPPNASPFGAIWTHLSAGGNPIAPQAQNACLSLPSFFALSLLFIHSFTHSSG